MLIISLNIQEQYDIKIRELFRLTGGGGELSYTTDT